MIARRPLLAGTLLASLTLVSTILAHAASPQSYTLKASDLGRGFTQTKAQVVSNAAIAKKTGIAKAQFDQHGRISGYGANFLNHATGYEVLSRVSTYKNARGAHWDYSKSMQYEATIGVKLAYKQIGAPKIGAESFGFVEQQKSGKDTLVGYFVEFRQGSLENFVGVVSDKGKTSLNQAVKLARVQAAREPAS